MQTNDVETTGQVASLQNAVRALERLGRLLGDQKRVAVGSLENFAASSELAMLEKSLADSDNAKSNALRDFVERNTDLQRLEELLAEAKARPVEFDLFEVLNLWWQEDTHSRVLTWLLGPTNNHGIGDYFLKMFLAQLDLPDCISKDGDWSKSESQREWYCAVDGGAGWLDILVTNVDLKFACAIENKTFSPEGGRQLTHYRKALEAEYPAPHFTKRYVFLSPRGMESQWEDEREFWKPITYTSILQLVEQTVEDNAVKISEDVRVFLRQYANTLRRKIVPESKEIAELARKIYLEHREAIELIYQNGRPDYRQEIKQIFREIIAGQEGWEPNHESPSLVRFRPAQWVDFAGMNTGTGWLPSSQSLMLFEFACYGDLPSLQLALSPGSDTTIREKLLNSINRNPKLFNRTGSELEQWMLVDVREQILDETDLGRWDDPSVRKKIELWVKNFAENEFPAMNEVIVNCLREYEAERHDQ